MLGLLFDMAVRAKPPQPESQPFTGKEHEFNEGLCSPRLPGMIHGRNPTKTNLKGGESIP